MKKCSRCGGEKSLNQFHNYKNSKDGKAAACKTCVSIAGKAHRERYKDEIAAKRKIFRQENREIVAKWKRDDWHKHRDQNLAKAKRYREDNPEKIAARKLAIQYNIPKESLPEFMRRRNATCAICGKPASSNKRTAVLHLDHDHGCCATPAKSCGHCIRDFICDRCNHGIGKFDDDPAILRAAADYIEFHRALFNAKDFDSSSEGPVP